jgi:hypothetical protein
LIFAALAILQNVTKYRFEAQQGIHTNRSEMGQRKLTGVPDSAVRELGSRSLKQIARIAFASILFK